MKSSPTQLDNALTMRKAGPGELPEILRHRRCMFLDMGYPDDDRLAAAMKAAEGFFARRLANGEYQAWFIEDRSGKVIAGGGVVVFDYHAGPRDPSPRRPVIVNVYTDPAHRREGLARFLMQTMIAWCRSEGFGSVVLHASDQGRHLYETLGFVPTNEMRLMLR